MMPFRANSNSCLFNQIYLLILKLPSGFDLPFNAGADASDSVFGLELELLEFELLEFELHVELKFKVILGTLIFGMVLVSAPIFGN